MEEELFLGLRKTKGVSKIAFQKKFNMEMDQVLSEAVTKQPRTRIA